MPVIVVTAPDLDDPAAALADVNLAVTTALDLPIEAAHAMLVTTGCGVTGADATAPWPTAVLHGRAREPARMAAAQRAVADVLVHHWHRAGSEVWVQWTVPM